VATPNAKADSIVAKSDFLGRRPFHDLVRAHFGAYPASAASMGIDSMMHGSSFGKGADFYFLIDYPSFGSQNTMIFILKYIPYPILF
jgi:hypothetical protein